MNDYMVMHMGFVKAPRAVEELLKEVFPGLPSQWKCHGSILPSEIPWLSVEYDERQDKPGEIGRITLYLMGVKQHPIVICQDGSYVPAWSTSSRTKEETAERIREDLKSYIETIRTWMEKEGGRE
jgi:hypothetical protein